MTNDDELLKRLETPTRWHRVTAILQSGSVSVTDDTPIEAAARIRELKAELAEYVDTFSPYDVLGVREGIYVIVPNDVREWPFYPIVMPITSGGQGPANIGDDAVALTWEVWDRLCVFHSSHSNLPDAINDAIKRTKAAQEGDDG